MRKTQTTRRPLTAIPKTKSFIFQENLSSPAQSPLIQMRMRMLPIEKLFVKKCQELKISFIPEQMQRFKEKIRSQQNGNTISLAELSIPGNCVPLIMKVINNFPFVNLEMNPLGDGIQHLQLNMVSLTLCNCGIGPKGFTQIFKKLCANNTLYHLNLGNPHSNDRNRLGMALYALAEALEQNNILSLLDISGCGICDMERLNAAFAHNSTLIHLNLADNELKTGVVMPSHLEHLNLKNNHLNQNVIPICEQIRPHTRNMIYLHELNLKSCRLDLVILMRITEIIERNQALHTLILDENPFIGENNLCISSYLTYNNYLQVLSLKKCQLTSSFIEQLASGLAKNTKLQSLDLSKNLIEKQTVTLLSEGLANNSTLKCLKMKRCGLNDESTLDLFKVMMKCQIEQFDFSQNLLADQSALYAIQLVKKFPKIVNFGFEKNINSYETQKQLMKILSENAHQKRRNMMPHLLGTVAKMSDFGEQQELIIKKRTILDEKYLLAESELEEAQTQVIKSVNAAKDRTTRTEDQLMKVKETLINLQKQQQELDKSQWNTILALDEEGRVLDEKNKNETTLIAQLSKQIQQDQVKQKQLQQYYKQNLESLKIQDDIHGRRLRQGEQELISFANQLELVKKKLMKKNIK